MIDKASSDTATPKKRQHRKGGRAKDIWAVLAMFPATQAAERITSMRPSKLAVRNLLQHAEGSGHEETILRVASKLGYKLGRGKVLKVSPTGRVGPFNLPEAIALAGELVILEVVKEDRGQGEATTLVMRRF